MPNFGWTKGGEWVCMVVLFAWLAWLPLPFGSVVEGARAPLIIVPLATCLVATLLRLYQTRDRTNTAQPTRPWLIWGSGALLVLALTGLQLVPMPAALLRHISPQSHEMWSAASRVVTLAGGTPRGSWPITIDPQATAFELFRVAALIATFATAALLVRTHERRHVLALVLCGAAVFEVLYGVREAALQRYAIWGWVNRLIFNRVTGTFVNPNHFAHYLAIVLPMAVFIAAVRWHRAGPDDMRFTAKIANVIEHSLIRFGIAMFAALACGAGILLAQSRGALLALGAGCLAVAAMLPRRRVTRLALAAGAGLLVAIALALFLGPERTVARFVDLTALSGRRLGLAAAARVWTRFPIFGSGAGTFERVVSMEQREETEVLYHHVHNDFAEAAATMGTLGFVIVIVALLGGYVALLRMTFGRDAREISWSRRAFQAAALASVTIAMVHALVDFNFYIPANPATLAAIAGAAVASVDHDRRTRR